MATDEVDVGKRFLECKTRRDVAVALNITYSRLTWQLYKDPKKYITFHIPKKSGGTRRIHAPTPVLKKTQRKLQGLLESIYKPRPSVHGFVSNRSILSNAKHHCRKKFVLNVDLKEFFPSIHLGRIRGLLIAVPYGMDPDVATVIAQLCCRDGILPQGAPTSPIISNMICAKMDSKLQGIARKYKCLYTRYADDLTFSTREPKFPDALAFVEFVDGKKKARVGPVLRDVIEVNGFRVNENKIRLQTNQARQMATGLVINDRPNVRRRFVMQIRGMLHVWQLHGPEYAEAVFQSTYRNHKYRNPSKTETTFQAVLLGKISFLGMVKGKKNKVYLKYLNWFKRLPGL